MKSKGNREKLLMVLKANAGSWIPSSELVRLAGVNIGSVAQYLVGVQGVKHRTYKYVLSQWQWVGL